MTSKTISLTGEEIKVDYSGGTNAWLRNDGTATVYASTAPGVTAGADGVVSIPAGQAAAIYGACGAVYLLGTGMVQLVGSDYTACPFKVSTSTGGESGVDEVARGAIAAHEGNAGIHISAAEKATWNGKADETDFTDHKNDTTAHVTADEKGNWNAKAELSDIPTTLPSNGGNADTLGSIPASELERVRHAVIGGAGGNAQWTGIDATKGDTTIRMQVDADYDKILLFKSVDGQQTWTEIELNADTLDGKHASDFANSATIVHESIDNLSASGFYRVSDAAALIIHQFWDNNFSIQIKVDYRASDSVLQWRIKALGVWGSWQKLNDGGSAASVGGYTEAKIAALEARIAALEGGGT